MGSRAREGHDRVIRVMELLAKSQEASTPPWTGARVGDQPDYKLGLVEGKCLKNELISHKQKPSSPAFCGEGQGTADDLYLNSYRWQSTKRWLG